jgi:ABC-type glycerol-3-phosphate transport system permease component
VYLHPYQNQSGAASDLASFFGSAFAQANPHTIVIAPVMAVFIASQRALIEGVATQGLKE